MTCSLIRGLTLGAFIGALALAPMARADDPTPAEAPAKADKVERTTEEWILDLGSDHFEVRERATEALSKLQPDALPKLEKAMSTDDPEVRWRLEKAIAAVRARAGAPATPSGEAPKLERARPQVVPGAQGLPDVLRELERELQRMGGDRMRVLPLDELFPMDMQRAFEEMDRALREFDRAAPGEPRERSGAAPRSFSHFRRYTFKDGRWILEEGGDGAPTRRAEGTSLGLETTDVPDILRAHLGLEAGRGLAVASVVAGSRAEAAGFAAHDVVLAIDDLPVQAAADLDLLRIAGSHKVLVIRGGEKLELTVEGAPEAPARREGPRGF